MRRSISRKKIRITNGGDIVQNDTQTNVVDNLTTIHMKGDELDVSVAPSTPISAYLVSKLFIQLIGDSFP